ALLIAVYAILGALTEFAERLALFGGSLKESIQRARGLPRSAFGTTLAHMGIGIALLGIVAETGWSQERIASLKSGDRVSIADFDLTFGGLRERSGPNWQEKIARFDVRRGGVVTTTIEPSKRVYLASGQPTTEAGIHTFGLGQLYIS